MLRMQTNCLICLIRVFKVKEQFQMTKVFNSKVLNHKQWGSSHWVILINDTYDNSQKGLCSSLLLRDSEWLGKSNTEYTELLVFSNFVETSKKAINLVIRLFDSPSLPNFCVTLFFWMTFNEGTTEKAIENTSKVKSFVYFFKDYAIVYTFSQKFIWNPIIPPNHPSRRVMHILYLHIVDM